MIPITDLLIQGKDDKNLTRSKFLTKRQRLLIFTLYPNKCPKPSVYAHATSQFYEFPSGIKELSRNLERWHVIA